MKPENRAEKETKAMKKIINGKMYNTDTAELIASDGWGSKSDFKHYDEELYRKKTGEFFLWGEGGPLSRYAEPDGSGHGWYSGSKIIPLDEEEAREWMEEKASTEKYIEVFGEPEE